MVTVSGSGRGKLLFVFLHHKEHGGLCREEDGLKKPPFQPDFDILAQAQVLQNRLISQTPPLCEDVCSLLFLPFLLFLLPAPLSSSSYKNIF